MTDLSNVLVVVGGVIAIIGMLAGVVGFFRSNVSKATIELYRQDNEALRARLKTLEEQVASDAVQLQALKASRDFLASVLTQADEMKALRIVVDKIASKVGAA